MMDVEKQISEITKLAYDIGAYPLAFKEELRTLLSSAQSEEQAAVQAAVPFMWAIQEPGGSAYMDKNCVSTSRGIVEAEVDGLNFGLDADDEPYKVVPVYLAASHPTQQGMEPIEQRQLAIGQAVERACKELPEGVEIQIYLERGAGTVNMTDWDGNEFDHFDEEHEDFACRINAATDGAIAAEKVAAQAKQGCA